MAQDEVINRVFTLLYLAMAASDIGAILTQKNEEQRLLSFSRIAFLICTEEIYQQDMPQIVNRFASENEDNAEIVAGIRSASKKRSEWFSTMVQTVRDQNAAKRDSGHVDV